MKYRKLSSDFGEALRDYPKDITLQSWTKGVKETGRCMHEQIKEHDRDIRLSRTQTIAGVFEHANRPGIIRFGTRSSLLTETLTGTLVGLKSFSHRTSP